MRSGLHWLILLLALALFLSACTPTQPADLAIRGVTVVDVATGSLLANQTVLVDGSRIVAVGPAGELRVPENAEVAEAAGRYLIPGLWDMHAHSVRQPAGDWETGAVANVDWHFPLFLAHGITGIRNMNDGSADLDLEYTNSVRRRLAEGDLVGPRLVTAGPSLDGDPPLGANPVVVRTAEGARAAVNRLADAGADFVKPYENLSREAYFAILDQAQERGLPVDGHIPFRMTPEEAATGGQRTIEHPDALAAACSSKADAIRERFERTYAAYDEPPGNEQFLLQFRLTTAFYQTRDEAVCRSAFETYRDHGVAVAVDLTPYHHVVYAQDIVADQAHMRLVPEPVRESWQAWLDSDASREFQEILRPLLPLELENVRLANEVGVTLLAGTDVGVPFQVPGLGMHEELARLVEAGLTPLEALRTATINPARVLGMEGSLGTVERGKLADLVLLDANPLDDIRNTRQISAVVADGRLYHRADLDRHVAAALAPDPETTPETTYE